EAAAVAVRPVARAGRVLPGRVPQQGAPGRRVRRGRSLHRGGDLAGQAGREEGSGAGAERPRPGREGGGAVQPRGPGLGGGRHPAPSRTRRGSPRMTPHRSPASVLPLALLAVLAPTARGQDNKVDFAHDVLPLLKEKCAKCHTNGTYKGGVSMDTRADLIKSK